MRGKDEGCTTGATRSTLHQNRPGTSDPCTRERRTFIFPLTVVVIHGVGAMPGEVDGKLIDDLTIRLDHPLKPGEESVVVRLRKHPEKKTKLHAPEEYILKLAEKDLEEL